MNAPSVISYNCSAQHLCKLYRTQYNSPTIGSLFRSPKHYMDFISRMDYFLYEAEPYFGEPVLPRYNPASKTYPVMFIDELEIHWIHEKTSESALRRLRVGSERLDKENIIFVFSESNLASHGFTAAEEVDFIEKFCSLGERAVYFSSKAYPDYPSVCRVTNWDGNDYNLNICDGITVSCGAPCDNKGCGRTQYGKYVEEAILVKKFAHHLSTGKRPKELNSFV
nr:DUF1919 domain-containing protein [Methylomagnum ishizawai]